ncbi:hypothetical protein ABPG74_014086 [Tetrahymena malaccensis]
MKGSSGNPNKAQQQYSSKFDKDSMDHQPHPVQKHFINQQSPGGYQQAQGTGLDELNEFQLEQYYEQMQALQNQEQIGKFNQQKQIQQINSNPGASISNGVTQQQMQQYQQQQQQILKQQQLSQQIQQAQAQQLNYEKKFNPIQSPQYSQDDLQDDHHAEGIDDENIYESQQMAQLANHLNGNLNIQGGAQFNNLSQGSNQNQNSNTNNSFSSAEEVIKSTDDTTIKEEFKEIDKQWQNQLMQDSEKYFEKIIEMNDIASQKLNDGQQREALAILYKAEKMLELAASCGKVIDRNLIIVVLYNRACAYQSLWILDKCSKYIDGVIYNLEMSLKEEDSIESMSDLAPNLTESMKQGANFNKTGRKKNIDKDLLAYKIKKQTFLVKSYLQCCAILSQQGLHQKALDTANEGATVLKRIFTQCFEFCKEIIKENEMHQTCNTMIKSPRQMFQNGLSQGPLQSCKSNGSAPPTQRNNSSGVKSQPYHFQQNQNNYFSKENMGQQNLTSDYSMDSMMSSRKSVQQAKEEVYFQKLVVEFAYKILKDIQGMINIEDSDKTQVDHFRDARRSLYFWKNNPENNERHIRQELNVPTKLNEEETRSILGVQNGSEWIESFNIGSIMHMVPVQYEEFSFFGDLMYEISKKMILEKVIYLSISYFTIATEIRFIEIERNKHLNPKSDQTKNIDTEGFKKSQIYHLKSIEIVCQHITCKSPYINHLITSYHKHYNQNLETILEESFSSFQDNNLFDGSQNQHNNYLNNQNHQQYNILQQEDQGQQFEELVNNFVNGMSEDDQTPVYIQNNPHLSSNNVHNINNSSLNNLQNNSMTKFNSINGQIIQSDDIILSNEKRIPSPNQRNGSNSNIKKQINGQQKLQNASQSIKSSYSTVTKSTENVINNKEKKFITSKQAGSQVNQVLTNSVLNKKNLNLDFNGNHLSSSTTNMHSANVNQQNLNSVNRNLAEFFSHENSKKNTPRGILNIRKSTPAVEQSSKEVALTEPNIPSSTSQPRSNSKAAKKSKQTNLQNSQIKKMNALTIEKVTQILKNNLLASYSSAFLSCSNVATLNHSKNPSSNQDRKKPQTANTIPTKQNLNSSPGLKKKSTSNLQQDPLRKSACIGQQQPQSGQRTNNSSIKNNLNNNSSSVPSTTQSSTKSKKQATSTTSRQQINSANTQTQLQGNTNQQQQQQQYCNTDRQIKDSNTQQQKVVLSEARESTDRNKIVKIKNEAKQKIVTTVPFNEEVSEKKKQGLKQSTSQSKNSKEQKNVDTKKFLSPSLTATNFLSLKTMKKETIQQLLKDSSKIIPKLNLSQLKLKTDDIRFFSPRETSTNSNIKKQQI